MSNIVSPRTIELYFFLQGYLQAAPQILLQLHILMKQVMLMEKQTSRCFTFRIPQLIFFANPCYEPLNMSFEIHLIQFFDSSDFFQLVTICQYY